MKLGYSVDNFSLESLDVKTNRVPTSLHNKDKVAEIILQNLQDLFEILDWNLQNNIEMYRISNALFPKINIDNFHNYPRFDEIENLCFKIGNFARKHKMRLSTHADVRIVLVTPKEFSVKRAAESINRYAYVFKLMGYKSSPETKINLHVGGAYNDKVNTLKTFITNFNKYVSPEARGFITIENDDRLALYTIEDLLPVSEELGIPIVFDYHHHRINPGNLSEQDALLAAIKTWPVDVTPVVHYSDEKKLYEDNTTKSIRTHADYIYNNPNTYGQNVDVMFESHAGDLSLLKYKNL